MREAGLHQWPINSSVSLLLSAQHQQQYEGNSALRHVPFMKLFEILLGKQQSMNIIILYVHAASPAD